MEGIQQRLVADESVAALVGPRVYPLILPTTPVLPAVTFQRVSTVRDYATTGPVSLSRIRLQVDTWAKTYEVARQVDTAIRASLEGFSGVLPDGTQVSEIQLDSSQELFAEVPRYYRVLTDYIVFADE